MPAGRPRSFNSKEELEKLIEEYFNYCDNRIRHVYSKKRDEVIEVIDPEPYTMAGLAYALGVDRKTLWNYSKEDEYFYTIKRARDRVQMDVERRLMEGNPTGAIFNLKNNFGYVDETKQTFDIVGRILEGYGLKEGENDTEIDETVQGSSQDET